MLETYSRLLPTFLAISICLRLNSSTSCLKAIALSIALRSSLCRFSIIASSSFILLVCSCALMITGTCETPASLLARKRRSPAISSYSTLIPPSGRSVSCLVTTSGCNTPYWRIESASSSILSSLKSLRG